MFTSYVAEAGVITVSVDTAWCSQTSSLYSRKVVVRASPTLAFSVLVLNTHDQVRKMKKIVVTFESTLDKKEINEDFVVSFYEELGEKTSKCNERSLNKILMNLHQPVHQTTVAAVCVR